MPPNIDNVTQKKENYNNDNDDDTGSISTCPSTCSSSSSSTESMEEHESKSKTTEADDNDNPNNDKDYIIAQLKAQLDQVKTESNQKLRHVCILAEKLMEDNQNLRQEVNNAHARIDSLEKQQLSSSSSSREATMATVKTAVWDFGKAWQNSAAAKAVMQALKDEEADDDGNKISSEESVGLITRKENNNNTPIDLLQNGNIMKSNRIKREATTRPMVTNVNVPIEEKEKGGEDGFEDESSSAAAAWRLIFQQNRNKSTQNTERDSSSKVVVSSKQQQYHEEIAKSQLWESFDWRSIVDDDDDLS